MKPLILTSCPECDNDNPSDFTRMLREDDDGRLREGVMCLVCGHVRYVERTA